MLFCVACTAGVKEPARDCGTFDKAVELFTLDDDRILESSGVTASSRDAAVLFTHNDSGGGARFYAVDGGGAIVATYVVAGARAWDWEDMGSGRAADGTRVLYLADIGDNSSPPSREDVTVYEVAEPDPAGGDAKVGVRAAYRLRYADRPHDAETLLVDPSGGRMALVTKERSGRSSVYATRARPSVSAATMLRRVARVDFNTLGTYGGIGLQLLATGGAVAPDGAHLVIRTYDEAFEWPVEDFDLGTAFGAQPSRVDLPLQPQGEAIAYSAGGDALIATSERSGAPVHRLARATPGC